MDAGDWDTRYAAEPTLWGEGPNTVVAAMVEGLPPGRAVDLACGNGRHAWWLANAGWHVTAVDFSATAIEHGRQRGAVTPGTVDWVVADALHWEPAAPVDLVLVAYWQARAADLVPALRRSIGWLAPGGRLLYLGHAFENHEHGVGGPTDPAVLPRVADLVEAAQGARVHALHHVERTTDSGRAIDVLLLASPWLAAPAVDASG